MSALVPPVLIEALRPLGVLVATKVPSSRPAEMVRIVDAGGSEVDQLVVDVADVTWEAWASDDVRAAQLALDVRALIDSMSGLVAGAWVTYATATRPRSFSDDLSGSARYVGSAQIHFQA